jgi:hypothetical protein
MLQLLSTTKQLTHSSSYHWHTFSDMVRLVSRSPCAMVTGNTIRQLAQLPSSFSTHHLSLLLCPSASAGPCNLQHSFLTSGLHQILPAFGICRPTSACHPTVDSRTVHPSVLVVLHRPPCQSVPKNPSRFGPSSLALHSTRPIPCASCPDDSSSHL